MKETVLKVAEYTNEEKKKMAKVVLVYFVLGIISLVIKIGMDFMELPSTFWVGFLRGATTGIAIGAMILGILYITGAMTKIREFKLRLIGKN